MRVRFNSSFGPVIIFIATLGCGAGDDRVALEGQVTLDGEPLKSAIVSFQPLNERGRGTGASVEEGHFLLPADRGLLPGDYRVKFQVFRDTGRMVFDPQRGLEIAETIAVPLRNTAEQQVTVAADGKNTFEFTLHEQR